MNQPQLTAILAVLKELGVNIKAISAERPLKELARETRRGAAEKAGV